MTKYEAAVVIPAYNEEERIQFTLGPISHAPSLAGTEISVVVVDNGSTDNTKDVVEKCRAYDGLDIHLIDESQKGTGAAADTGFRYAIEELGANIIARTDADTVPMPWWFPALYSRHKKSPKLHLLTGPVWRGFDEGSHLKASIFQKLVVEDSLVPLGRRFTRIGRGFKYKSPAMFLKFAPGYNLSTTREAYLETGGFPRTDFSVADEDVVYNALIAKCYGRKVVGFERGMEVFTSSRRLRSAGFIKSALHYASVESREVENLDPR